MTIEDGTRIVLAYVLVSVGVIVAFLWAALMLGTFIGAASVAANSARTRSNTPLKLPAPENCQST